MQWCAHRTTRCTTRVCTCMREGRCQSSMRETRVYQNDLFVVVSVVAGDASDSCLPKDLIGMSRSPARCSSAERDGMSHTHALRGCTPNVCVDPGFITAHVPPEYVVRTEVCLSRTPNTCVPLRSSHLHSICAQRQEYPVGTCSLRLAQPTLGLSLRLCTFFKKRFCCCTCQGISRLHQTVDPTASSNGAGTCGNT
jgi:hypothetical protein